MERRFTPDNTDGYSPTDLARLNELFSAAVYLPPEAFAALNDLEVGSWHDHVAELVMADFDAASGGEGKP